MKRFMLVAAAAMLNISSAGAQAPGWEDVQQILERKGTISGDILKETFPRTDLHVNVGKVRIEPGLALTSWVAFAPMPGRAMLMGDLVLLEREVDPVMHALYRNGLEVTALHNHLIGEDPHVMYMHIGGLGEPGKLAKAVKDVLSRTGTAMGPPPLRPEPAALPEWTGVDSIMGRKGARNGNLLQFSIPRADTITDNGMLIPPSMGMATAINLQKAGTKAAATGDFVLTAGEVNPVMAALTSHGIAVTAIHSHMLSESPRLFFMHFWVVDDPQTIAGGIRAALDKINVAPGR